MDKRALSRKRNFSRVGRRMVVTTALDKARTELAIMKKVDHPHIVRCFEIIDDDESDHMFTGLLATTPLPKPR